MVFHEIVCWQTIRSIKVSKVAKIRNRYNQVPHLTQDTNGKVPYFCQKLGKMSQNLLSAAVVIGALRVKKLSFGSKE